MKRRLSVCFAVLFLMLCICAAIPVHAAQDASWGTLFYEYDPLQEGDAPQGGQLSSDGTKLERASTISCNSDISTLRLNGVECPEGKVHLVTAGEYKLTVQSKDDPSLIFDYYVDVLPVVTAYVGESASALYDGRVFTAFPTIVCENVANMHFNKGLEGDIPHFVSGSTVTTFGRCTIEFEGVSYLSSSVKKNYNWTFYIRLCSVERAFDEAKGKEALRLTVGDFAGEDFQVFLDGDTTPLTPGTHYVSTVGQHTLSATHNGQAYERGGAMPNKGDLNLQMELSLPSENLEAPVTLRLSVWDAQIYVNGKPVTGNYRIEKAGDHVIEVRDANGAVIPNAILFTATDKSETASTVSQLTLHFNNPHHLYVIFVILPAVLLLGAAVCFWVMRRRIV